MKPENHQPASRLAAEAKQVLERSLADLPPEICSRLRLARHRALEGKALGSRRLPILPLRWAGGLAMASLAAVAVALWIGKPGTPDADRLPVLEDLQLITSEENLDLSQDLDFYGWLAETPASG